MKQRVKIVLVLLVLLLTEQGHGQGKGGGQNGKSNIHKTWTKTTKTTTTTTSTSSAKLGDSKQACGWFNKERDNAMPGACAVVEDEKLNKDSEKCADYYADKQEVDYTCPFKGDAGEFAYGSKNKFDMKMLSRMSVDEKDAKDFDYSKPNYAKESPNQGTWPGCNRMGFGKASKKGFTVAVALVVSNEKKTTSNSIKLPNPFDLVNKLSKGK